MKVQKWFWKNGVCIGYLDEKGNEIKITLQMLQDIELHQLYHEEIKRHKGAEDAKKTNKRKVHTDYHSWGGFRPRGDN